MLDALRRAYQYLDLPLLVLFLFSVSFFSFSSTPASAQLFAERGYQPRGCGFDLDDDGLIGEPADDCRICNGLETDPDGDGVDEDLIYVDCDSGADAPGCGSPGNPCGSLQYALVTAADGPADGAEDIVCVKGTCSPSAIKPATRGIPGHRVAPAQGSDEIAFQYPTNPAMIVGWDSDGDGQYPPFDSDDVAVLDGTGSGRAFLMNSGRSNDHFEIAHLDVRDYNVTTGANSGGGFIKANQGRDTSHLFVHDVELKNMAAGKGLFSGAIVVDLFSINGMEYMAIENVSSTNMGAYFVRGSGSDGPNGAGPIRFKNITLEGHGGCTNGCTDNNRNINFRIWGYLNGFEITDSVFDADLDAVPTGQNDRGSSALHVLHCVRDLTIRNNSFINYKQALSLAPGEWGCDLLQRSTDNVKFDRNSVIATSQMDQTFGGAGINITHGGSNVKTLEDLDVTNNFFSGPDGHLSSCVNYKGGNDTGPNPGTIRFSNNTCHGDMLLSRGALDIGKARTYMHENWIVENNIFGGLSATDWAIRAKYNPLNWQARSNSYSPNARFEWNGGTAVGLATFKSQSQSEVGSDSCEAALENPAGSDLHLRLGDTCARDKGVTAPQSLDIDGQVRASGDPWDRGADEAGATGGPGSGQTFIQWQAPADEECVSQSTVQVSGYADDPSGVVSMTINGAPATVNSAPNSQSATRVSFQALVPLQAGGNQLNVTMSVGAGSSSNSQRLVYRDLGAPMLNWSSTIDPNNANLALIQGTVDDESGVQSLKVNGTIVSLQSSFSGGLSFNHSVSLNQGSNNIIVEAVDVCQNVTTQQDQIDLSSNSGPTVFPQTVQTVEESAVPIQLTGTDPDGDQLTFEVVTPPANGVLTGVPPALSYLPNPDYYGTDQLRFRATDGQSHSSTVAVTIQVSDVNDQPVARSDAFVAASGSAFLVQPPGVLANDVDVDADPLTVTVASGPQHGTLNLSTNGGFTYTPASGYAGADQFTYRLSDGRGGLTTAQVNLTVQGTQSGDVAVSLGGDITLLDNKSLVRSGSFSSRAGEASATVNFGDNTGVRPLALKGRRFDLVHTYASEGVYLVEVCVTSQSGSGCGSLKVSQKLSTGLTLTTGAVEVSSGLWVDAHLTDSKGRNVTGAPLRMTSNSGCTASGTTDSSGRVMLGCNGSLSGSGQVSVSVYYDGLDRDVLAPSSQSTVLNVSPDSVIIEASASNLMKIGTPSGKSRTDKVDFVMQVRERLNGGSTPGNLGNATVTMEILPMTTGTADTANCTERVNGEGLNQVLAATCSFTGMKPDAYWLKTSVSGPFSGVHYESFVVSKQEWLLNSGAGSFIWPGSENPQTGYPGDRTTFAYNSVLAGNQVTGQGPGNAMVVVRTYEDGTMSRFERRTSDIHEAGRESGAPVLRKTGSGRLWERGALNSRLGTYDFYTVDRSTNGNRDEVWIRIMENGATVHSDLGMHLPIRNNLEVLTDGNVKVQ